MNGPYRFGFGLHSFAWYHSLRLWTLLIHRTELAASKHAAPTRALAQKLARKLHQG
jgi:hypothetical protein